MIKLKISEFFSFFRFRTFLLVMNLLFVLDFYIYAVNQEHIYEINLKTYVNFEFIYKVIILTAFYFVIIQILYFLASSLRFVIKNDDVKYGIFLDKLKFYSIKENNIVVYNLFLKEEKELEEQYQEQVLAFGFVLFFVYSFITGFDCFGLIGIKHNIFNNLFFCGVIILLFLYCIYISLFVPMNRNYINDEKLKDIIKDEK